MSQDGPVLTVTINRPHRKNAIDGATWVALHESLEQAAADDSVRALVLTGAGGDFSAGADLSSDRAAQHPLRRMHDINAIALALHELPKPVVAKVRGVAVGAGWNLALGCDLVVSTPDARFSQIFAKRGLSLDFGGSWLLPRLVGMQQAKRLALLGEIIGAEEALGLGLVTWVKPDHELDGFVTDLANRLAHGPPIAMAQSKQMLHAGAHQSFREALENEARAQTINFATADGPAAREAFMAKAEPKFTGEWLPG
ncbi:enoyl-CoA hydratase-related protein [Saccharopolyspora sp. K220]|uniref:enoyl-CoA hydratase/isomerase family protein n=1 Tax=Saccharopolyspora soli TaxID=2926618 RepID=UPI001F55E9CE|nr:enoyl-CoA hydratase-related protein [Saccharopolyspora soli]MCI2417636.1 enoyl-CoA hydratase-related protein [Saccharopolyspora soli]